MPTVSGFSRDSRQGPAGRRFEVFTNRSPRPIYLGRMIKPPIPPDLTLVHPLPQIDRPARRLVRAGVSMRKAETETARGASRSLGTAAGLSELGPKGFGIVRPL